MSPLIPAIRKSLCKNLSGSKSFVREMCSALMEQAELDNNDLIENINLFQDEYSKVQFEREIYFLSFKNTFGHLISPLTPKAWDRALELASHKLHAGEIPRLHTVQNDLLKMIASNFVLKQYEYYPHFTVTPEDIVIDGGAYIGDTSYWAYAQRAQRIYAFEPGHLMQQVLHRNISEFMDQTVEVVPLGIGRKRERQVYWISEENFAGSGYGSRNEGKDKTPVELEITNLDYWCKENAIQPSLIKLDVEGAEIDALSGAAECIQAYRPKLAISLYHNRNDMLLIPRMIKSFCTEYRLWCRKSHPRGEFILYASV